MLIVRMVRPERLMIPRRNKQRVNMSRENAETAPSSGVRLAFLSEPHFFCQRIGLPPVTAYRDPLI